jgi:hypothetical protein
VDAPHLPLRVSSARIARWMLALSIAACLTAMLDSESQTEAATVTQASAAADRDPSAVIARARERAKARAAAAAKTPVPVARDNPGVDTEVELRRAWENPRTTRIDLTGDIYLRNCRVGDPIRESPYPMVVDGHGHFVRQTCFEKRLLRQDGTGYLELRHLSLSRGGSDGPGAAVTTRGEIKLLDCTVTQNLAEEPGGGVFSMRRATVIGSRIAGNLANDDGGGVYARRGGVQVYDSVLSNNLVDGSGGAIGSTGDILVVRTRLDGNTTDGDGGALYTDEAGDVAVVDSTIDGSTADGPGGAIFTLEGDVAIVRSTLGGNRADDRGGAVSGEADVLVVNSTIGRNAAVAHVGGGVWARGNLFVVNSTIADNYAEGEGGGIMAAGHVTLFNSTVSTNSASVAANVGTGGQLTSFGSIIGPARLEPVTGHAQRTRIDCRVYDSVSMGFNFVIDGSCRLTRDDDVIDAAGPLLGPLLEQLTDLGHPTLFLRPLTGSPVLARIPSGRCAPPLPTLVPGGHLVEDLDWSDVLAHDQVGNLRDTGAPCDIGAVQVGP